MKKYLLLLIFGLLGMAIAAEKTAEKSSTMPIDVVADKGSYDQQAGFAIYEGNVKITQGVATIWADKVTVILKNNTAERIEADGKPTKFDYRGEKQPIKGSASHVVYEVLSKTVELSGNAVITQGKDNIKGSRLSYNLDKEVIEGSRVKMTFQPGK